MRIEDLQKLFDFGAGSSVSISTALVDYYDKNEIDGFFGGAGNNNTLGMSNLGNSGGTSGVASGSGLQFLFAGGNNITLSQSLNGSSGTISIHGGAGGAGGTQTLGISNLGNTAGTSGVATGAGVALYLTGGNNITLSQSLNGSSATVTISAFNTTAEIQSFGVSNLGNTSTNPVLPEVLPSFGVSNLGNTSGNTGLVEASAMRYVLVGGNNITLSQATGGANERGTLTISAANQSVQTQNMVSVLGSSGNISFGNANGITFGGNASTITASHNGLTSQSNQQLSLYAAGNTTQSSSGTGNASNLSFQGAGVASVGVSNGSVVVSVPAGGGGLTNINLSAGTTSQNLSNFVLSNANGVSFGLNGSTITASANAGGGGYSLMDYANIDRASLNLITNMTATGVTQRPLFIPFELGGSLTHNVMHVDVSRATGGSNAFTMQAAIYTLANSTQLSRLASLQNVFSNTATASVSGNRLFRLTGFETVGSTLTPGQYVMMLYASATATASMNYSWRGGATVNPPVGLIGAGTDQVTTATSGLSSIGWRQFHGRYTATTASPPSTVGLSQVAQWSSGNYIYFHLGRT